ncbi:MAG: Scr1 family TA system antitoxin-like transcriptional regulator [Pseudonocardia sp.]
MVVQPHGEPVRDELVGDCAEFVPPFTVTGHPAMGSSTFHLLGFPTTRLPTLGWLETVTSTELIDNPTAVHEYTLAHIAAAEAALDVASSIDLITRTAQEIA